MFEKYPKKVILKINNTRIEAKTAVTLWEKSKGLMNVKHLNKNKGVLFMFKREQKPLFWMFKTYIPLDILWISGDGVVSGITKNTLLWKKENKLKVLTTWYRPKNKVKYALEVNGGWCENNSISKEDKVTFNTDVF